VIVAEWWRGQSELRELIRRMVTEDLATAAGVALAEVKGVSVADAIVMASAARRGDVVYTSDFDDLQRLRSVFPTVRVLSV
jgi:hypothetical protein